MRVRRNECVARRDCVTSQSREAGRVELRKTQICNRLGSSRPRAHGIARDCLPLFPFSGNACLAFPGGGCCVLWPARGWEYCQSQRLNCITYYCLLFGCSLASPSFSPLCARARASRQLSRTDATSRSLILADIYAADLSALPIPDAETPRRFSPAFVQLFVRERGENGFAGGNRSLQSD